MFSKLFDPIIQEYHGFGPKDKQPPIDLGETHIHEFPPLDPEGKYIQSTRIRCGRTLNGYPFNPLLKENDYLEMQSKVKSALESVSDKDLKGTYYPLEGMSKNVQKQLIQGTNFRDRNPPSFFRSFSLQRGRQTLAIRKCLQLLVCLSFLDAKLNLFV